MTQCDDHWPTISQFAMHFIEPFGSNKASYTFQWHPIKFDAGEKIRAKPLKVFAHQKTDLAGVLFPRKGDPQIAPGEAAVVGQSDPSEKAQQFAKKENHRQREDGNYCQRRSIEEINAVVEHADSAGARLAKVGQQRKFACESLQPIECGTCRDYLHS